MHKQFLSCFTYDTPSCVKILQENNSTKLFVDIVFSTAASFEINKDFEKFFIFLAYLVTHNKTLQNTEIYASLVSFTSLACKMIRRINIPNENLKDILSKHLAGGNVNLNEDLLDLDFDDCFNFLAADKFKTRIDQLNAVEELRNIFKQEAALAFNIISELDKMDAETLTQFINC